MSEPTGRFVLEQKRELDATPERVFNLLTEPGELVKWWGPHGFTIPEVSVDLRVGGAYRFTMQPPEGDAFHLSGEFIEVHPPVRLSFTFRWDEPDPDDRQTVVVLLLENIGGATAVALSQGEFSTAERLELHRGGWSESFEKLEMMLDGPDT